MAITTSGYIMLGMLRVGSRSGYEIRRSAELSLRHFWSVSPPQVYGELAKLEEGELIEGTDDPRGNRFGPDERFLSPIVAEGLVRGKRHHVHIS